MEWEKHITLLFVIGTVTMIIFAVGVILISANYFKRLYLLKKQESDRLLQAIMEAERSERKKIAYYLHETLCNDIFAVGVYLTALEKSIGDSKQLSTLTRVQEIQKAILEKTRALTYDTLPPNLEGSSLDGFFRDYFFRLRQFTTIKLHFHCPEELPLFDLSVSYEIFRIIQQLINNALEHGKVTTLTLSAQQEGEKLTIDLEDDGIPFDIHKQFKTSAGLGITTVFSRLQHLNASLRREPTTTGNHFVISFKIP